MFLPDVNFWLALAFESQSHHVSAKNWMQLATPRSIFFCRVTQLGFLRLATNRKAFPIDAVTMNQSWRLYDEFSSDERVGFAEEPDLIEGQLRMFTQLPSFIRSVVERIEQQDVGIHSYFDTPYPFFQTEHSCWDNRKRSECRFLTGTTPYRKCGFQRQTGQLPASNAIQAHRIAQGCYRKWDSGSLQYTRHFDPSTSPLSPKSDWRNKYAWHGSRTYRLPGSFPSAARLILIEALPASCSWRRGRPEHCGSCSNRIASVLPSKDKEPRIDPYQ